jgi:hypothetical protein
MGHVPAPGSDRWHPDIPMVAKVKPAGDQRKKLACTGDQRAHRAPPARLRLLRHVAPEQGKARSGEKLSRHQAVDDQSLEGKSRFLKKAAQKLLLNWACGREASMAQFKKVFCFFFSKKKPFP